jgi:hypothetical protein
LTAERGKGAGEERERKRERKRKRDIHTSIFAKQSRTPRHAEAIRAIETLQYTN